METYNAVLELLTQVDLANRGNLSKTSLKRARKACKALNLTDIQECCLLEFLWYPEPWYKESTD